MTVPERAATSSQVHEVMDQMPTASGNAKLISSQEPGVLEPHSYINSYISCSSLCNKGLTEVIDHGHPLPQIQPPRESEESGNGQNRARGGYNREATGQGGG